LLGAWIQRIHADVARTGLHYEYYELAAPTALPDFDSLTPDASGVVSSFDISVRQREDDFALRYRGYLRVDTPGDYIFYTSSDDGSQLFLDQTLVVDNDGLHGLGEVSGGVALTAGYHEIVVTMFEAGGGQALFVSWEGPATGGAKTSIGAGGLFVEVPLIAPNDPPVLENPGERASRQGDAVALQLSATDGDGDALYFDATGLPDGLAVDHGTGEISGTLVSSGTRTVIASASDGPDVSVVAFDWTVVARFCGDAMLDDGEQCDDGNTTDGDGCSALCEIEGSPMTDGGVPDSGIPDSGVPDGGVPDAGIPDSGIADGGVPDSGQPDAGTGSNGSGCSVQSGKAPIDFTVVIALLSLVWLQRRLTEHSRNKRRT
jgi:cysteine-rich repeat protein